MTNTEILDKQRDQDLLRLYEFMARLPLTHYMEYMWLHTMVKKNPLDALLMGRENATADYEKRVKKWVIEAIRESPHLNN